MTLVNRLKSIQPRISENVNLNAVTLDIERLPGQHSTWHRGQTITGPFWDLNEIKAWTGKRIHADDVSEWPRTICAAWKWYDQPDTVFAAEWEVGGYDGFMRAVWDVFDQADLIIGHNADRFDARHLMGGWVEMGLPAPSPYKVIDTLKIARGTFAYESNTLDALNKRLGIDAKTDKYDSRVAKAAVAGDKEAQDRIRFYNMGDIAASEALFDRLRPFAKGIPHLGMWTDDALACPSCGHTMTATGKTVHANVQRYEHLTCPNCGSHARGTATLKNPTRTRSAR